MIDFSTAPISAIFVFHDPRNWALDIQIIIDVIQSRGVINRALPLDGATPVELVFCNPDLLWRSEFPRPRLGQGAFREAFQAVFKVRCCLLHFSFIFIFLGVRGVDFHPGSHGGTIPTRSVWQAHKTHVRFCGRDVALADEGVEWDFC